jgi:uncharacterized protein with FMN-binding domain
MKRAPIVLAATVFGTGAVLGFHARPATLQTATAASGSTASTTASTPTAATKTTASSGSGSGTALGDAENTRYGIAQVRVTVSNGKITKVEAVQLQSGDPHSAQISSSAEPVLQQSVLSKQTADVGTVSGATYTSLSYEASLQSALDKLGFKAPDGSTASTDVSQLQ